MGAVIRGGAPLVSFLLFLLFHCGAALSIPRQYDGFVYGGAMSVRSGSISVEAFLDPVCPDSRDTWAPLLEAVRHYSPHLSLIVHPFPLPYHDNSFLSCRALHIANVLNESATFPLLELFFEHQAMFYNDQSGHGTKADVIKLIVDLAREVFGNSLTLTFEDGFSDPDSDMNARTSFKYGCSRGVIGTPFFLVNGFALPDAGSAMLYDDWKSIIDPLITDLDE